MESGEDCLPIFAKVNLATGFADCTIELKNSPKMRSGWMAERSKAAVLKTAVVKATGGSNPSPSAQEPAVSTSFSEMTF